MGVTQKDMMFMYRLSTFSCLVTLLHGFAWEGSKDEPTCTCMSRFDYDFKMLKALVDITKQNEDIREALTVLTSRIDQLSAGRADCKDGWVRFRGSCYLFSTLDKVRIDTARDFCNERGAHLVRIESGDENRFVEDYIKQLNGRHFYIDLSDEIHNGEWVWHSNGEPATFFDWDEGEPLGGEYCAAISTNAHDHGRWIDLPCHWKFASPLCEIEG